ncbi:hypothetical protein [Streptomyces sp. NPDC045470]|uniref:hypothetical protein n=1 Tax=Streptomyces sp. NPDC045470 TaxID=3155469 RepID=UPI0033E698D0
MTWIQRAVRLTHLDTAICTVRDHHVGAGELAGHPAPPFRVCPQRLSGPGGRPVPPLEAPWERRDTSVALWERARLPVSVRERIMALQDMVTGLSRLCFTMNLPQLEAH